jgi:hypothetical protein
MFKFKQNKIKEGEIHFQPIDSNRFFSASQPTPAVKHLPQWYKNIERNVTHTHKDIEDKSKFKIIPMGTVKKCIPVLDAFSAGYIYSAPIELFFSEEAQDFAHNSNIEFIQGHDGRQLEGWAADPSYIQMAFKWRNLNIIKTAPGWSCLFTHPLNRLDLPFYTLSGVVDTDVHPMPVNFPFVMKRGFTGKIFVGTPLVQIIPFKRQDWKSVTDEYDPTDPAVHITTRLTEDIYKKTLWNKKRYN